MKNVAHACYCGIDPGKSGGLAKLYVQTNADNIRTVSDVELLAMPLVGKEYDVHAIVKFLSGANVVGLEKVHSMPGQGVKSMFTFGEGYGMLKGILYATQTPFVLVTPQAWHKTFCHGLSGDNKERALSAAMNMYPAVDFGAMTKKKREGVVDALLIATYAQKMD